MAPETFDLVVIGGGNAVSLAMGAAKAGLRTCLIEKGLLGGTCPNVGCIPSKLLLGYAERANLVRDAGRFHMQASLGKIDGKAILAETFGATRQTDGKLEGALAGVTLIRGAGRFVSDRVIDVGGRQVTGDRVVIATGTRPRRPTEDIFAGMPVWTSDDVFLLDELPASITIVGGGYIACELGTFFAGVGVDTTMVVRSDVMLRAEDTDIRDLFRAGFTSRVNTKLSTSVVAASHAADGFKLELRDGDGNSQEHRSEALLFALGREPSTDVLGLADTAIELDESGYVQVDDYLRTTVEGVYALGDIIGEHLFTHAASFEAGYLLRIFTEGHDAELDYGPMPHAVFASPEVAGVGATEQELSAAGTAYQATALPFTSAAKGRAVKEEHGLVKFMLAPDGTILGCHIVGHEAATLLHEVIPVMKWRNHISSLTEIIHIHPSLPEVIRNCARKAQAQL